MRLLHSGKVRDVYEDRGDLILVASDRVSVFDVVLPTPIPDKGRILTALSLWWFGQLADLVPNHVISAEDVPEEFAGRAIRCKKLDMLPVECVARGYLTGGGLREYEKSGTVSGVELPPGLLDGSALPQPIFTPSTKADVGDHDEPITYERVEELLGEDRAADLEDLTLRIYELGSERCEDAGIILADTKLEFGLDKAGEIVLADEVLTPDSSRFWPLDQWKPGARQASYDKQFLRDWAEDSGWDKTTAAPELPTEIANRTRLLYIEAYQRITGEEWV
ncbi:phosphoribosylaminoimidazolesuccinocarboxamide synthase [Phytomonospora endophytica]|uniref:Phosphoribosylaminoimidazole-succinocarboxamide synthase n=1 Tax=Phytomonospora endophytica TaxID=714109 RepID=A0A841FFD4_9ACTN|nr:phosphoribosylaminoimidazolesuccinocarboxamide synthase [Phytomonospora endophytica]MBB6036031.1 phosphoribosylaminoimidazole-succinocarboxamide synthase [Phytomonospora endophytica]GIG66936.1 phosphoribosylaminoimidazole-succinocarboxamide synthase [Phytomonospora endophytica]